MSRLEGERGRDGWSPVVGSSNASGVGGASTGEEGYGTVERIGEIRFVLRLFACE